MATREAEGKVLQVIEPPYSSSLHKPDRSDLSRQMHACASHERSRTSKPAVKDSLAVLLRPRLATENPVSEHLPADRDRRAVGIAEEEIAWR